MSEPSFPSDWRTLYAVARLEGNATKVPFRVEKAEEAIQVRLRALPEDCSDDTEQARIAVALRNLRLLKASRLTAA